MQKTAIVTIMACAALASGCGVNDSADETHEIIDNLRQAGFPDSEITVVQGQVVVGGDAVVSLLASREMLEVDPTVAGHEQYRTTNIVSPAVRFICVDGSAFTGALSTGLNQAIQNYEQQTIRFTMRRIQGPLGSHCEAVITAMVGTGSTSFSQFPGGGRPGNFIVISAAVENFDPDFIEGLITHELGHTIGFRHSDWFDRSISCGVGPNGFAESADPDGAQLIPGTPSGAAVGQSIMNACFPFFGETGELRSSDITALTEVYRCDGIFCF